MTGRHLPTVLRWAARWRAAVRIARRDAARHRGRTALVAALVALPLIAGSAGLVLLRSTEPSDASIVRDALGSTVQARITVVCEGVAYVPPPSGTGCDYGAAPANVDGMAVAFDAALPDGSSVIPVRSTLVDYLAGSRSQLARSYAEIDLAQLGTLSGLDKGRVPRDRTEILVGGHMARSAPLDVGDTVALRPATRGLSGAATTPVELTVVGVSRVGAGIHADFVGLPGSALAPFTDDDEPNTWYVTGDAPVLAEHASLLHPLGLEVLSRDLVIDSQHPGNYNRLVVEILPTALPSATTVAVLVIVLLEAVLLIGPAFVVGARRETRNLALVAATGGESADLRRIVLATGLVVGGGGALAGTVLGATLGASLVPALREQDLYVPNLTIPGAELLVLALGGTAIAVAAAWLPARHAARTDVVAALNGRRPLAPAGRRAPVVGLTSLGLGVLTSVTGGLTGHTVLVAAGIVAVQLGIIGTAGTVVRALARSAHRAGPAIRFALRDADRHRARTAPALAAIIAATAIAGAGMTFQASKDAWERVVQPLQAAPGTVIVGLHDRSTEIEAQTDVATQERAETYATSFREAIGEGVPVVEVVAAAPSEGAVPPTIERLRSPAGACSAGEREGDPRCDSRRTTNNPFGVYATSDPALVDDGATVLALGLSHSDDVARSLATGHVVVSSERDLWTDDDGETFAHLSIPGRDRPLVVPAVVHPWGELTYPLLIPSSVVDEIGWAEVMVGLVVPATPGIDEEQSDALRAMPEVAGLTTWALVQADSTPASTGLLLTAVSGAALLSILATWIVVGLASAESRPDLATISAVGASPSTRRRLVGAQAGVLSIVGTALGVVTGVFFGGILVLAERTRSGPLGWMWQLELPWLFLAILASAGPLLAIGGAAAVTRSRLPLTRRLAS